MKRSMRFVGLAFLAGLVFAGPIAAVASLAYAQDAVVVEPGPGATEALPVDVGAGQATEVVGQPSLVSPWWQAIWGDIKGPLLTFAGAVVLVLVRRYLGEKGAQIAQEMLADAVGRSAGGVINTLGDRVINHVLMPGNPAVQAEVSKLKKKMPDTIKKTGATDHTLAENIVNSVGQLLAKGGQVKPVSGTV